MNAAPFELDEQFGGLAPDPRLRWFNEPSRWELSPGKGLSVWTDSPTDFWQRTHYGFQADSGHLLGAAVEGDFQMFTDVAFFPLHQYDQAGLMVRFSPDCWLKCSVEYEPEGPCRLGCVVTNHGYSDWSTQDFPPDQRRLVLQIRRVGPDFHVEFAPGEGQPWSQMRIAHLAEAETDRLPICGAYACSPQGEGFCALFHRLRITTPFPA